MSALSQAGVGQKLALAYLARGADEEPIARFERFVRSYRRFRAGIEHDLFVIFKGFTTPDAIGQAQDIFAGLPYTAVHTDDDNFDLGAYRAAAEVIPHERLCFLNSNSEVLSENWLAKLADAHSQKGTGIACATGSYESLWLLDFRFPRFPNIHARSNAFVMTREHVLQLLPRRISNKKAAFFIESGPSGLTRRLLDMGLSTVVVGRNGRCYQPQWWPSSHTFRQGTQNNLLVHDNVSRAFEEMPFSDKLKVSKLTWGGFIREDPATMLPSIP